MLREMLLRFLAFIIFWYITHVWPILYLLQRFQLWNNFYVLSTYSVFFLIDMVLRVVCRISLRTNIQTTKDIRNEINGSTKRLSNG